MSKKDWLVTRIYELDNDGYSLDEIALELECSLYFVKKVLGY